MAGRSLFNAKKIKYKFSSGFYISFQRIGYFKDINFPENDEKEADK